MIKMQLQISFCFVIFSLISFAQQNYKYENFGDKSVLLNGNVTGSVSDLGATFYNPSRLTTIKEPLFSINGKIYQLNTVKLQNYVKDDDELKSSDFISLPRMVAGTFKVKFLPNSYLAYSLLSRQNSNLAFFYDNPLEVEDVIPSQEGLETYNSKIIISNRVNEEWYGASWATELNDKFNIGVSMYFSQFSARAVNEQGYSAISEDNRSVATYSNVVRFEQNSYGFFTKLGVSYTHSNIELGLNVDVPYLEVFSGGKLYQNEILTGLNNFDDKFSYNKFDDLEAKRKYPLGIQIGAGIKVKKSTIHLNTSWNTGIKTYDKLVIPPLTSLTDSLPQLFFKEQLKHVINFGFGVELFLSENIDGFLSYSSDFSQFEKNTTIFDLYNQQTENSNVPANFHHVGLGSNFSIKSIDIALGAIYSTGKSSFNSPSNFPNLSDTQSINTVTARQTRWRIIAGINLSLFKKAYEKAVEE